MGYEISCIICEQTICSKYAGESGRNLFMRGGEHITDCDKKVAEKPLWKHIKEKHGGRMEVGIFEHFGKILVGSVGSHRSLRSHGSHHETLMGLIGLMGLMGLIGLMGLMGLMGLIGLMGLMGLI